LNSFKNGRRSRLALLVALVIGPVQPAALAQSAASFQQAWESGTPQTVSGELATIYADDFAHARAERIYVLRDTRTKKVFTVRFDQEPSRHSRSGRVVTLSGRAHGSELYVLAAQTESYAAPPTALATAQTATVASGDQKTLVIVANFRDESVTCSTSAINDAMFSDPNGLSVDSLYRDNSLGKISFSGNVVGPYTVPFASTDTCDISAWADAADAEATATGVDLAGYAHKVYVMPANACPGAGFGTVGGTPSGAWVFACNLKGLFAHELGHNLGMDHASTPTAEYGDSTDPMAYGSTQLRGMNAPHRQQLGWLGASSVQLVDQDGTYDLAPLARDPGTITAAQTIMIAKPDTAENYYLSYRVPEGFDSYIDGTYSGKLSVHRYRGDGSVSRSFLLAGLRDGEQFTDQANGITVTLVSHDSAHATAQIDFVETCDVATPSVALSPPTQSGEAGTSGTYTIALTNNDPRACANSTFQLSAVAPGGWGGALSPSSLTLEPGTSGNATLTLTASASAAAGTYPVSVVTSDSAATMHSVSTAGSYTVTVPCIASLPTVSAAPTSQSGTAGSTLTYALTVTNRNSAACAAGAFAVHSSVPAGWAGAPSASALTLAPGQSVVLSLPVTSSSGAAAANYAVIATVTDSQSGTASSAQMNYTVQASSSPPPPAATDTVAPTAPSSLRASASQRQKQIQLSWAAATDNVGPVGYRVLRNGSVVGTSATAAWSDPAYVPGAKYTYQVVAYDPTGNVSLPSNAVTITLSGGGKK
jgi:M6 family metalloprotease-like protein